MFCIRCISKWNVCDFHSGSRRYCARLQRQGKNMKVENWNAHCTIYSYRMLCVCIFKCRVNDWFRCTFLQIEMLLVLPLATLLFFFFLVHAARLHSLRISIFKHHNIHNNTAHNQWQLHIFSPISICGWDSRQSKYPIYHSCGIYPTIYIGFIVYIVYINLIPFVEFRAHWI